MDVLFRLLGMAVAGPILVAIGMAMSWVFDSAVFARLGIWFRDLVGGRVGVYQCPNRATKTLFSEDGSWKVCDACFWRRFDVKRSDGFAYIRRWIRPRCSAGRTFDYREFLPRPIVSTFVVVEMMPYQLRLEIERKGRLLIAAVDNFLKLSGDGRFIEAGQFRDSRYSLRLSGFGKKSVVEFAQESVDDSVDGKSSAEGQMLLERVVRQRLTAVGKQGGKVLVDAGRR